MILYNLWSHQINLRKQKTPKTKTHTLIIHFIIKSSMELEKKNLQISSLWFLPCGSDYLSLSLSAKINTLEQLDSLRVLFLLRWEFHLHMDIYCIHASEYIYIYKERERENKKKANINIKNQIDQESHFSCQSGLPNVNSKLGLLQLRSPYLFAWSFDLCSC